MSQIYHTIGKKKTSIARVFLKPAKSHSVVINGKAPDEYFSNDGSENIAFLPLRVEGVDLSKYELCIDVYGGGFSSQAHAIKHGISKALVELNVSLKKTLRDLGFLTRDPRCVERKKFGQPKARKKEQFSKR